MPFISVCIPAYNRVGVLPELLDSILEQSFKDYEIVICEDCSPQRREIAAVVSKYSALHPRIRYMENQANLGYDGNLRNLIEQARGTYCLFMGNDDLMCLGALEKVAAALSRYPNVGVLLRSYAAFEGRPENIVQTFRYFDSERLFPAGPQSVATLYRRSVVIPGMVIHREAAREWASERFDGSLLYQLYLVANILLTRNAVFLPDVIVLYRNGGVPDFGNSEKEKGKFVPQTQTPESSLHFMQGMLDIAAFTERSRGVSVYRPILRDIGNYSYPILSIQAGKSLKLFAKYCWGLARMGLWRSPMFYVYTLAIFLLGTPRIDKLIVWLKKRIGHTPILGKVYTGESS